MTLTTAENQIEDPLIKKLEQLKYVYRSDIRDRAALEANFRQKFESLNQVRLTDGEFTRLLEEITTPDVFSASRTNRVLNGTKPYGNILDFRQQQDAVDAAIALFSGETTTPPLWGTPPQEGNKRQAGDGANSPPVEGWQAKPVSQFPSVGGVSRSDGVVPKLRFPEFRGTVEWGVKRLGDVCEIATGLSNRVNSAEAGGAYTFFDRSQDIRTSDIFLFDGEGQEFIPKYFVGKFDLHQRTYAITNFSKISGKYLYYYLYQFRNYFLSQAVGSTVKSLRLPMFQKMPIHFPSQPEQQKIADCLSSLDDLISAQTQKLACLKTHKKGLMQQLFPSYGGVAGEA